MSNLLAPAERTQLASEAFDGQGLTHLDELESEAIHIIREVVAEFENPVMLYSVGKDSSVMVRLAQKAFYPGPVPFPLLHIDTGYKFKEMIEFRDAFVKEQKLRLIVHSHQAVQEMGTNPYQLGTAACCALLKTQALLQGLEAGGFDAAFGGARRDEEKSRAKERIFSFRDRNGQWNPQQQRPELWNIYNTKIHEGESLRVFPLSNWTELDVWRYIAKEEIPIVPLYFAQKRKVVNQGGLILPLDRFPFPERLNGEVELMSTRFRSLGCSPCTGAIPSTATTVDAIIEEMLNTQYSERAQRVIDFSSSDAMEKKKREGYF